MLNVRYNLSTHRLHLIDGTERPLKYMLNDFWTDYSEPYSRGFPLVSDGPWNLLTLLGTWLLLILILQARAKAGLAKLELRPLMLIFNSFQFAINFLGFLVVAFYITDFGVSLWSCTFSISGNFHLTMTIYMGYLYILAKLVELTRPVIALLRGKISQLSWIDCLGQVYYLLLIYIGFTFRPFGVFVLLPFVDLLHHTFVYVYLIFACTGTQLMKSLLWWKYYLPLINMLKFAAIFGHSVMTFSSDCHEPIALKYLECSYSLFGFVLASIYMLHFVDKEDARRLRAQQEQLKKAN